MTRGRSSESGFTLIELMIVVVILGVLAALVIPNYGRFVRNSKCARTASELRSLSTAFVAYQASYGDFPPDSRLTPPLRAWRSSSTRRSGRMPPWAAPTIGRGPTPTARSRSVCSTLRSRSRPSASWMHCSTTGISRRGSFGWWERGRRSFSSRDSDESRRHSKSNTPLSPPKPPPR